jgi:predicted metal-binding membrane protein
MLASGRIEKILQHERALVLGMLAAIVVASWLFLLAGAGTGMSAFSMTSLPMALGLTERVPIALATPAAWTVGYAAIMVTMWWVMMIAMMLPSASPVILLHAKVAGEVSVRAGAPASSRPTAAFLLGYLLVWGAFSVVAAAMQWAFEAAGVLSPMMMNSTNDLFAGLVLLVAGVYQLSPIKHACLRHCRGPLQFFSQHWRDGSSGAFRMGLHHGLYCLGCCWGMMLILFFGGLMNLYWIVGLALFVLLEKLMAPGQVIARLTGGALILGGAFFIVRSLG